MVCLRYTCLKNTNVGKVYNFSVFKIDNKLMPQRVETHSRNDIQNINFVVIQVAVREASFSSSFLFFFPPKYT